MKSKSMPGLAVAALAVPAPQLPAFSGSPYLEALLKSRSAIANAGNFSHPYRALYFHSGSIIEPGEQPLPLNEKHWFGNYE